jgi:lysyl-tRNA synthetase class 2
MSEGSAIDRIMNERRQKGESLKALGQHPHYNGFVPTCTIEIFNAKYFDQSKEALESVGDVYRLAGRVMATRNMGKAAFMRIKDRSGETQVFIQKGRLTEGDWAAFDLCDVGDFVGVEGTPMRTKTGELSINITKFLILTKSLRPLPEKWHGLSNVELRYRNRDVDLIVNDKTRAIFLARSKIIRKIQSFLDDLGFIEVETPILMDVAGGAEAKPFLTHHNALGEDLALRIATEIHLKRLVIGGIERVYEIGRMFRNEGVSTRHNPEFTSIEFYQAYATYEDLMILTEKLLSELASHVTGSTDVPYQGDILHFGQPFRKVPIARLVGEHLGLSNERIEALVNIDSVAQALEVSYGHMVSVDDAIATCLRELSVSEMNQLLPHCFKDSKAHDQMDLMKEAGRLARSLSKEDVVGLGKIIDESFADIRERRRRLALHLLYGVFDHEVEEKIIQPTFITDFSVSVSPLARKRDGDPAVVDRFELIIAKMEIANAFSELTDADDQRERFLRQVEQKALGDEEAPGMDEDFLHALEVGMPPTAGQGFGVDRLVMLLTDSPSIREVILFPKMRKK